MTYNSNFVVLLEINNPSILHKTGNKVESELLNEGGFRWTAAFERRGQSNYADYILRCGVDHYRPWKCDAEVALFIHQSDGTKLPRDKYSLSFHAGSNCVKLPRDPHWGILTNSEFLINGKLIMEFHIRIINAERSELIADPDMFSVPHRRSDIILKIGEKKLHVSKEFLAVHSPVLETLFFGDFAENGKEEFEIKDVIYEEFVDLLHLLYTRAIEITDRNLPHILKLADRFQMECVLNEAERYLKYSKEYDVMKKLLLADQYNLVDVRDHCLNSFTTVAGLVAKVKSLPEYENFSGATKNAICDRIMKI